ncbi:MAG: glycosyltransferase family 4 protein [Pseudonocardiaceae bacterium]
MTVDYRIQPYAEVGAGWFPDSLHIFTYDVRGTVLRTGQLKRCRQTGLVTHTHQLLGGFARAYPNLRLAITQTGAQEGASDLVRTPEGQTVLVYGIQTGFPDLLRVGGMKCPHRVQHFYESAIDDPDNPVYRSLAGQYATAIRRAGTPHLIAQNINPLVSILKADEFGLLGDFAPVHVIGVVHDTVDMPRRLDYVRRRLAQGTATITLIAVSQAVRRYLLDEAGIASENVRTVCNGIDAHTFCRRVEQARQDGVFERVRARNGLPTEGRMLFTSARRVTWKGHHDVLHAITLLAAHGCGDFYVVFNGASLVDTRDQGYEKHLAQTVAELGLRRTVFLLDELTDAELAACYGQAHIAVHPSRLPEPFGYANIEAMLAGVPVITTAHGAPLEYITHGISGLLVPLGDPPALATAIDALLSDQQLHARLAVAGRASASRFGLDAMVRGYQAAIRAHLTVTP